MDADDLVATRPDKPPIPDGWAGEPRFVVFFIPAPVPLALPHGSSFTFSCEGVVDWLRGLQISPVPGVTPPPPPDVDGQNWVSLQAWRRPEELYFDVAPFKRAADVYAANTGSNIKDTETVMNLSIPPGEPSYSTVFEAVTPLLPEFEDNGGVNKVDTVSKAFNRCMEAFFELYQSYITVHADLRIRTLNRRNSYPMIPWTTRDPFDADDWGGMGVFMANSGEHVMPFSVGALTDNEIESMAQFISRTRRGDPLSVFAQHSRSAGRAFYVDADFASTVVWAHTSAEVLLDTILLMLAWEEQLAPGDVAAWFGKGLLDRVKRRYHSRLKGTWDVSNSETVPGRWVSRVHRLRNSVVHQGYQPTEREAQQALEMGPELEEHIKLLLIDGWRTYPQTMLLVLGTPGLERRGRWRGKLREYAEAKLDDPDLQEDWLALFVAWSERVRRER